MPSDAGVCFVVWSYPVPAEAGRSRRDLSLCVVVLLLCKGRGYY